VRSFRRAGWGPKARTAAAPSRARRHPRGATANPSRTAASDHTFE
jgi:hypothetical protein